MDGKTGGKRPPRQHESDDGAGVDMNHAKLVDVCRTLAICVALVGAVAVIYAQTARHHFIVCDDDPYIYANPHVPKGFTWEGVEFALTQSHAGNWHPLTWLSHMLDVTLYRTRLEPDRVAPKPPDPLPEDYCKGDEYGPGGHHVTSAVLHAASAVLLFLALRKMTGACWLSALVAAMFAVHPLRVESVAWAAERKDVLSGFFWMLTLLAYGWYARRPGLAGFGRYIAVAVSLALGLSAKSMLVTLPCVLLLLDVWPLRRWRPPFLTPESTPETSPRFPPRSIGQLLIEKIPLFGLSATVSAFIAYNQVSAGAASMAERIPFHFRAANAAVSSVMYLWKEIWPTNLAIFYPHPFIAGTLSPAAQLFWGVLAALALAVITAIVLLGLRRAPYLAVGWFWYLGALVPVIGLIQVGVQGMADRYTYLPMVGVTIMVVWSAAAIVARLPLLRAPLIVAATGLLVTWTYLAYCQTATWKNGFTVFKHAIKAVPGNYFAHNHLGRAYSDLWGISRERGCPDDARKALKAAGKEYIEALRLAPNYDSSNGNVGWYYSTLGQSEKALPYFLHAAEVNPNLYTHQTNVAAAYANLHRYHDAAKAYEKALQINPDKDAGLYFRYGTLLYELGRVSDAREMQRKGVALCRDNPTILAGVAMAMATSEYADLRDGPEAVKLAKRANELAEGKNPTILAVLAASYAEAGNFVEAVETMSSALSLAPTWKPRLPPGEIAAMRRMRALFENGQRLRRTGQPPLINIEQP